MPWATFAAASHGKTRSSCTAPARSVRSPIASPAWMADRGWRDVNVFDAGYPVWQAAGLPVETRRRTEQYP